MEKVVERAAAKERKAKQVKPAKPPKVKPGKVPQALLPTSLTLRLAAPGMSALHRAGLGGLACSLRYLQRAYREDLLDDKDLPGGPWTNNQPPWEITPTAVTLHFGKPQQARSFLEKLFALTLGLRDGLIYLPGQYPPGGEPTAAVRAELQAGLLATFLQHGKSRTLDKEPVSVAHDPDDSGLPATVVKFRKCDWYKHQNGHAELATEKGLNATPAEVVGPLNPGAMVRHVAFAAATRVEETTERLLPLYFAPVGCLAFATRDQKGAPIGILVVPEVTDLTTFATVRPFMTPTTEQACKVAGASDAVLQAQVRLKVEAHLAATDIPGATGMTFVSTPWASQQKSRASVLQLAAGQEKALQQFATAWNLFPPRKVAREVEESVGKGKAKRVTRHKEAFWSESVVRPLVAENLATGRPWYAGFTRLMIALDQNGRPLRDKLAFEKKGLQHMTQHSDMFAHPGERAIVQAVHEALRSRYGQIADENKGNPVVMKKRWEGEYDRWRLAFAGAKTADQFRAALVDLFSRGGGNKVLRQAWETILPLLNDRHWQLSRDLALLALPSYASIGDNGDSAN